METRLNFLDKASESLGSGEEVLKIKSHLRYVRELFLQHGEWSILKKKDSLPSTCRHCFMEFRGTSYTMTLKPSPKPSHNVERILHKKAMSQHLTPSQIVLLTHYQETQGKKLVLKCGICQRDTEFILRKQKDDPTAKKANTTPTFENNSKEGHPRKISSIVSPSKLMSKPITHLKKKKKKDQFAGLKKTAVLSIKPKKKK